MNKTQSLSDRIQRAITQKLQEMGDPKARVTTLKSSLGWIQLRVVSQAFVSLDEEEREAIIDEALATIDMHLGMYPFAGYTLLTLDEAKEEPAPQVVQLPLWSQILLAPEPESRQEAAVAQEDRPLVVTFYSFKGGVGRTTALAITAGLLAEAGRQVVMVDFDLEAPGLSVMLSPVGSDEAPYGVLDYIYQRWLTPYENIPPLADCVMSVGRSEGDLLLVPAGEYDENYIHRLADFDVEKLYRQDPNPIHELIDDIVDHLSPDVILVDARTGFDEMGAIALFDLADLAIVCFNPNEQSYRGLEWVIKAAHKQKQSQGKPDLRFVLTPMPPVDSNKKAEWLTTADDWIAELWGLDKYTSAEELRAVIDYQAVIPVVGDILQDLSESIRVNYKPIVDFIDAALPGLEPFISVADSREQILEELQFEAVTADQIKAEDIPNIFQRTSDFPRFLSVKTSLIRGAKGTGKSLLFRLFVEQSETARELAQPYANLREVQFIGAHGRSTLDEFILSRSDFDSFEVQVGDKHWESLWRAYTLLRLAYKNSNIPLPDKQLEQELETLTSTAPVSHARIVSWLVNIAQSPVRGPAVSDAMRAINEWLEDENQQIWLLYDELDTGFGSGAESYERRRRALEALLSWWLEASDTFSRIKMKCFIRQDIWRELNFPNKSHYTGRDMVLRWQEDDLWRLVLRQALNSPTFTSHMHSVFGLDKASLEKIDVGRLRGGLHSLWGERMGRGKKAYTHRWVLKRIADGQENRFPRSLVLLLTKAVENERSWGPTKQEVVLRPRSLLEAMHTYQKSGLRRFATNIQSSKWRSTN